MTGPGFAAHVMADRLSRCAWIVGAIGVIVGGAMVVYWEVSQKVAREKADVQTRIELQERIIELQEHITGMQQRIDKQDREMATYADLAKVSRGILLKQRDDCEAKLVTWTQDHCGDLCARSYEFAEYCKQIAGEMKQIAQEGHRAIEKLEAEQKAGWKP